MNLKGLIRVIINDKLLIIILKGKNITKERLQTFQKKIN